VRREGLWVKHMGLKQGVIGNTLGKCIGKLTFLHVPQVSNVFIHDVIICIVWGML